MIIKIRGNISKLLETRKAEKIICLLIVNKQYLGYQDSGENLGRLRTKLRYGENPSDDYTKVYEIGNQQPRL